MSYECEETMLRFEPGPYQIKETAVHNIRPLYYALYNLTDYAYYTLDKILTMKFH